MTDDELIRKLNGISSGRYAEGDDCMVCKEAAARLRELGGTMDYIHTQCREKAATIKVVEINARECLKKGGHDV